MNILENSMVEEFSGNFTKNMNKILLGIHIILLAAFFYFGIYLMVFINIFSIIVYSASSFILKRNRALYLKIAYVEIAVHMTLAVLCMGWDYGFQLYCIAMIPMIYYADYLGRKSDGAKFYPFIVSTLLMLLFIALKMLVNYHEPIYVLKDKMISNVAFVFNASMTGAFMIYFMSRYKQMNIKSENMIREYAQQDALTGLKNKSWLLQMEQSYFEDIMQKKEEMIIAILDIDDFKKLNDTYGHQFGDKVLFHIAMQFRYLEKKGFYVCRWGGEEFLIFGSGKNMYEDSIIKLERLIQKISETEFLCQRARIKVTVTVGVAKRTDETNFEMLMKKADEKLYLGKRSGKNKVVY